MSTATPAPSSKRCSRPRWTASPKSSRVEVNASTRLLAVIGDPVAHSLSPSMHNAAIAVLGLDAVYVALRTPAPALVTVLAALAAVGGAGNVTVPHKEAAERCVARKTDVCARVGACNTFWTEQGALVGDNTDVAGILAALRQLGADGAGSWLLVGTGGAARAVAVAAAAAKADLHVLSRDAGRARDFADWASRQGTRAAAARGKLEPDIAINATPAGLKDTDPLPLDPDSAARLHPALDLVDAPGGTSLVRRLRAAGAVVRALPAVRRLARGLRGGAVRRMARSGCARRGPRAEVRRPATYCHRLGRGHGRPRRPRAGVGLARPRTALARPLPGPRLQSERAPGARAESPLAAPGGRAAGAHAGHRRANGVDTRRAAGERGGSLCNAKRGRRNAEQEDG